jgi:glycerol kinase
VGEIAYPLDGGVFSAGSLLDWLAKGLGPAADGKELAAQAAEVSHSAPVIVLPALALHGAPGWSPTAWASQTWLRRWRTPSRSGSCASMAAC